MCDGSMAAPVAWWLPTSRVCSVGRSTVPILSGTERPGPSPKYPDQVSVACMVGSSEDWKGLVEELG